MTFVHLYFFMVRMISKMFVHPKLCKIILQEGLDNISLSH